MNRVLFLIHLAWQYIKCRWQISIIIVASLVFGLVLPFLAIANANVFTKNIDSLRIKQCDALVLANVSLNSECTFSEEMLGADSFLTVKKEITSIETTEGIQDITIYSAPTTILDYENFGLVKGTLDNGKGEEYCFISDGFLAFHGNVSVGDVLKIHGIPYTVGGIFSSLRYHTAVFLLSDKKNSPTESGEYVLYIQSTKSVGDIKSILNSCGYTVSTIQTADSAIEESIKSGKADARFVILISLVCFLISTINIASINKGKYDLFISQTGTEFSIGATTIDVFITSLLYTLILLVLSLPFFIIISLVVRAIIPSSIELCFDFGVYAKTLGLGLFMCLAVNLALLRKIMKTDVASLMRGEN